MDEDSENVQDQSSSSGGNRNSKAGAEILEDVERGHEMPSFAEGLYRNAEENEEDEEARLRKTVMFLNKLAREAEHRVGEMEDVEHQFEDEELLDQELVGNRENRGSGLTCLRY